MDQAKWGRCVHPDIRQAAGKLQTVALKHLMATHNMGGSAWLGQFDFGFPIDGALSQRFAYHADGKVKGRISSSQLFQAASNRFRERAPNSGNKHAQLLWGDALAQAEKGWLLPPTPHGSGRQAPHLAIKQI